MAEVKYPCPQCKASLKLKAEVPAGKKIKCPKCEAVFAPVADKPKPAPAKAIADDEGGGVFGFKEEAPPPPPAGPLLDDDEDQVKVRKRDDAEERLEKRFPKGKRGPAQAIVMKPSNQLLATASLFCVSCIVSVVVLLWPMLFSLNTKLTSEEVAFNWTMIGACVVAFLYNGVVTYGAVQLQSIESLSWATIGSFMMLLPTNWALGIPAFHWFTAFVRSLAGDEFMYGTWAIIAVWCLYVGVWNVLTIRKPEVLAGFAEKREDY
jgi:hypothetical protein